MAQFITKIEIEIEFLAFQSFISIDFIMKGINKPYIT